MLKAWSDRDCLDRPYFDCSGRVGMIVRCVVRRITRVHIRLGYRSELL